MLLAIQLAADSSENDAGKALVALLILGLIIGFVFGGRGGGRRR